MRTLLLISKNSSHLRTVILFFCNIVGFLVEIVHEVIKTSEVPWQTQCQELWLGTLALESMF